MSLARTMGDVSRIAQSLLQLGELGIEQSNYDTACRHYSEALDSYEQIGNDHGIADTYMMLVLTTDDPVKVKEYLNKALLIKQKIDDKYGVAGALGKYRLAARIIGSTNALRDTLRIVADRSERKKNDEIKESMLEKMGTDGFTDAVTAYPLLTPLSLLDRR